jgi:DNA-binding MarR family transcriptional regulator
VANSRMPSLLIIIDFDVLEHISRRFSPCPIIPTTQLMHAVMLCSGAMTNRIDRLGTAGLVKREPDSSDRRGLQIALTSKGLELINWAIEARLEDAEDVVQLINHRDRQSLEPLLRKLIGEIEGDSKSRR